MKLLSGVSNYGIRSTGRAPANIDLATKGRSTTAAAVKRCLRGSNPDGIGTEIYARGIFAGR